MTYVIRCYIIRLSRYNIILYIIDIKIIQNHRNRYGIKYCKQYQQYSQILGKVIKNIRPSKSKTPLNKDKYCCVV